MIDSELSPLFNSGDYMRVGDGTRLHLPRVQSRVKQPDGSWVFTWSIRFTACGRAGQLTEQVPELSEICALCRTGVSEWLTV